jgi:TolB protein
VIFASNFENAAARGPFFDLWMVPSTGGPYGPEGLKRITTYSGFDSFPMFSPDGKWLAFSSNRGGATEGETNVFVARWKD